MKINDYRLNAIIRFGAYYAVPSIILLFIVLMLAFASPLIDNLLGSSFGYLLTVSLPMLICFAIIPPMWANKFDGIPPKNLGIAIGKKSYLVCSFVVTTILLVFKIFVLPLLFKQECPPLVELVHFAIVGISEEILFRGILLYEAQAFCSTEASIFITAVLFAFVGHATGTILANLMLRFPLGVLLAIIRLRGKSIYPCALLHFAYNIALL
jgi:membrane protease YdiL (CAAX protease family)